MTTRGRVLGRILAMSVIALVSVAVAPPAVAGGWWSTPDLEHETRALAIGESTTAHVGVLFPSAEEAQTARSSEAYYAYLVRGIDEEALREAMSTSEPGDWWTRPDEVIRLGPATLHIQDSNLGHASATFVVPEVEPGAYDLMFCDRGCSEPLADVVPLRSVYVGDLVTVRTLRDSQLAINAFNERLDGVRSGLDRSVTTIESVADQVDDVDSQMTDMAMSIDSLRASVDVLERRVDAASKQEPQPEPWWTRAGWFVAGLALAGLWTSRRWSDTRWDDEDDDLRPDPRPGGASETRDEAELPEPEFITLG